MPVRRPTPSRPARRVGSRAVAVIAAAAALATGTGVPAPAVAVTAAVSAAPSSAVESGAVPVSTLAPGVRMSAGRVLSFGTTWLVMQTDGNLVLYSGPAVPLWASHTARTPGAWASLKTNGQLVVRTAANRIVYASPVRVGTGPEVVVGEGEMVVRTSNRVAWTTGTAVRGYAVSQLPAHGWDAAQWPCLDKLWERESGWNPRADNPSSGAYGVPQALPGSKMASVAADWRTNHRTQITWGLGYIADRYGSPCGAWSHSQRYGWYSTPPRTVLTD